MIYYTLAYILQRLKKEGLPASRPYFNALEQAGIVPPPDNQLVYRENEVFGTKNIRIYSQPEVDKITEIIKNVYKK